MGQPHGGSSRTLPSASSSSQSAILRVPRRAAAPAVVFVEEVVRPLAPDVRQRSDRGGPVAAPDRLDESKSQRRARLADPPRVVKLPGVESRPNEPSFASVRLKRVVERHGLSEAAAATLAPIVDDVTDEHLDALAIAARVFGHRVTGFSKLTAATRMRLRSRRGFSSRRSRAPARRAHQRAPRRIRRVARPSVRGRAPTPDPEPSPRPRRGAR